MFTTLRAVLAQSFCDSAVRVYSEKGSVLLGDTSYSVLHTLLTWRDSSSITGDHRKMSITP